MAVRSVPDGASRFDAKRLPERPILDTGVWLRALGWEPDASKMCRDFVDALTAHEKRILMATGTLAELLRGDPDRDVPNGKGVIRVSFDSPAAERLGRVATAEWLGQFPEGVRRGIKFDALIAASGREAGATCMVAWERGTFMRKICEAMELRLVHPEDFLADQARLDLGTVAGRRPEVTFGRVIDVDIDDEAEKR